jgi:hypothetical protein
MTTKEDRGQKRGNKWPDLGDHTQQIPQVLVFIFFNKKIPEEMEDEAMFRPLLTHQGGRSTLSFQPNLLIL